MKNDDSRMTRLLPGTDGWQWPCCSRATAHAAAPGITGTNLQPDGASRLISASLTGRRSTPGATAATAAPTRLCAGGDHHGDLLQPMQVPGPDADRHRRTDGHGHLTNNLPTAAGNTSILFPGLQGDGHAAAWPGLLTQEAAPGGTVTYTFTAASPGTRAYYSGTQGDLQVEMGLYGAIIVLPSSRSRQSAPTGDHSSEPDGAEATGAKRISGWRRRPTTIQDLLRPGVPVPVLRDGSEHSHARRRRRSRRRAAARPEPRAAV